MKSNLKQHTKTRSGKKSFERQQRGKCFNDVLMNVSNAIMLKRQRDTTKTGRPRIQRLTRQLTSVQNVNDSGHVALFVKLKRWGAGSLRTFVRGKSMDKSSVEKGDGPARLPRACFSLLERLKNISPKL